MLLCEASAGTLPGTRTIGNSSYRRLLDGEWHIWCRSPAGVFIKIYYWLQPARRLVIVPGSNRWMIVQCTPNDCFWITLFVSGSLTRQWQVGNAARDSRQIMAGVMLATAQQQ
jgi:hypothetical protein